ncbi:alpha-amlyase, partial [Pseudomonas fluorescens]
DIRRDFPGGWQDDEVNAFKKRTKFQKPFYEFTKKLLNYRKGKPVLHDGKFLHYVPENNCYVYFRYSDSSRVMVVINNNTEKVTLNLDRFKEGLQDVNEGLDILSGKKIDMGNTLSVSGKTSMVIDLDKPEKGPRFF